MGTCYSYKIKEMGFGHEPISLKVLDKLKISLCKIKNVPIFGTGFFMKYKNKKFLLTCFHVINSVKVDVSIEIEKNNENNRTFKLALENRDIRLLPDPIDITIIEIKDSDLFIEDIGFLDYDSNYDKGYQQYEDINIFNLGYPDGNELSTASGKINRIDHNDFYHTIDTKAGSSGSPILLFNTLKVIGIHKEADTKKKLNVGIFIGEVINNLESNNPKLNKITKNDQNIIYDNIFNKFDNMRENRYEPNYEYYKENNLFVIKIEAPGDCKIRPDIIKYKEYAVIKILGQKKEKKEIQNVEKILSSTREFGNFSLNIPIKQEGFYFKQESPRIIKNDGIFILYFRIEELKI